MPRERHRPGGHSALVPKVETVGPVVTDEQSKPRKPDAGPPAEPMVYLSARVPLTLRAELQHEAIRQGRPVAQLLQDAVRSYLVSRSD